MKLSGLLKLEFLLLLFRLPSMREAQYYSNPFYYSIITNTVTITGYNGSGGTVVIPGTIPNVIMMTNLPVTAIGPGAFASANMTSVVIGTNVAIIGQCAFSVCQNLDSVTLGTNVTTIGPDAFLADTKLVNVIIPDNVTGIGTNAFGTTSITNIVVPASVTNIEDYLSHLSQFRIVL